MGHSQDKFKFANIGNFDEKNILMYEAVVLEDV